VFAEFFAVVEGHRMPQLGRQASHPFFDLAANASCLTVFGFGGDQIAALPLHQGQQRPAMASTDHRVSLPVAEPLSSFHDDRSPVDAQLRFLVDVLAKKGR
jgi:hypothetical protein